MNAIIFNGALERRPQSTVGILSAYIAEKLNDAGVRHQVFNLAGAGIPLFDNSSTRTPAGVNVMSNIFLEADIHFWLAPLYHGSIPGTMKNCLDWLEITAKNVKPYLTDKTVGLVCWADGVQAMQGINTMDAIAKSLRAWPLPFSVPITRALLYEDGRPDELSPVYKKKLDLLVSLATTRTIAVRSIPEV